MKYLVMGCNGMAGHMVSLYLKEQGHDVTGFARKESDLVKTIVGDATDFSLVKEVIRSGEYDVVVNCIGVLNKNAEDNVTQAILLNAYLPNYLVEITKDMKTRIIHLSTDCVFSGNRGQYKENDFRDGDTLYARTKALGELNDNKNITIRTSIIGPDRNLDGIGLLNWFMKQEGTVKGYTKAMWTGITTLQLAKVIETLGNSTYSGLLNIVPETSISKYDLLVLCKEVFKKNDVDIAADDKVVVDKSLVRSAYVKINMAVPSYVDMVNTLHEWIISYRSLYADYYLN